MPFFSVIVPTLNSALTLYSSIKSIIDQTYLDFEILIIDGCSKDNTITIAKNFNDDRIKIYIEQDNGVYDAMNEGIKNAEGKWLYFFGSDDVLYDNKVFEDVMNCIQKSHSDFVYGNVVMKNGKNIYDGEFTIDKLYMQKNICHQAIFYSKSIFEKVGIYNLRYKIWADWDLNIRCFLNPSIKIVFYDKIICIYNDVSGVSVPGDPYFGKFLPVIYINEINQLTLEIKSLQDSLTSICNSKTFRIATYISDPFRRIKKLVGKSN